MSTRALTDEQLTAIADAIRLKTDNPAGMTVDDMPLQIGLIQTGGGSQILHKTGSWVAEQMRFRRFKIEHNLNIVQPYTYIYVYRFYIRDSTHVFSANNIAAGGNGVLMPTTARESDGYTTYEGETFKETGYLNGIVKAFYSGSKSPGNSPHDGILGENSNNQAYVESNKLTIGLGLRACQVGETYDWELFAFKEN